ncbi:hypothetical protein U1Q18_036286 [Sarracenia purpurea var. burkii]
MATLFCLDHQWHPLAQIRLNLKHDPSCLSRESFVPISTQRETNYPRNVIPACAPYLKKLENSMSHLYAVRTKKKNCKEALVQPYKDLFSSAPTSKRGTLYYIEEYEKESQC